MTSALSRVDVSAWRFESYRARSSITSPGLAMPQFFSKNLSKTLALQAEMDDVVGFKAGLLRDLHQTRVQALVDQEAHSATPP
jgi:hypothetical protein